MLGTCFVMKNPSIRYKGSLNRAQMQPLQGQAYATRLYSHPTLYPGEQLILQQDHMMCIDSFDNYAEGIVHLTTYRIMFTGTYANIYINLDKTPFEEDAEELSKNASRRQSITSKKNLRNAKNHPKTTDSDVYKRQETKMNKSSSPLRYSQSVRKHATTSDIPGYDDKNAVKLMTYRPIIQGYIERINHPYDLELSIPCASISEIRKYSKKNLPKGKSMFLCDGFEVLCSNIKSHRFCLGLQSCYDSESLIKILLYHTKPSFSRLFAFPHRNAIMMPSKTAEFFDSNDAANFYKFKDEYVRMGFATATDWRVPSRLCEHYPKETIVPSIITDQDLEKVASFHREKSYPAVCWRRKSNGIVMLRSSTTTTRRGLLETRCEQDEKLLNFVSQTNESATKNKLVVFTEQPKQSGTGLLNTSTQRMNHATGQLTPEQGETFYYANCKFVYTESPPDYRTVRQSACKLQTFLATVVDDSKYLSSLEETEWLALVSELLQCATQAAVAMDCDRSSALFCYDDGLDRTSQLASLTQLLLDPFYRTVDGFQVLIQKEWLSFVHKFSERALPNETTDEHGPVFLQWLDCVWQVTQQFPFSFEFNSSLLETIAESVYSCRFGDFIATSNKMKEIKAKTTSLWTWINIASMSDPERFVNPRYKANPSALFPRYKIPYLKVWTAFYSTAYKQENVRDANKAGYIQALKLDDLYKDLQRKHSKLSKQLANIDSKESSPPPVPDKASVSSFTLGEDSSDPSDGSSEDIDKDPNDPDPLSPLEYDGMLSAGLPKRRMTRSRSLDDMLDFPNPKTFKRSSIKRKVGGSKFYTAELLNQLNREPRKRLEVPQSISETFSSLQDYLLCVEGINSSTESNVTVTDMRCCGYMVKLGKVHKNWKKRWFVLDLAKSCLAYFENEKSHHPKGAISKQSISQVYRQKDTEKKKRCQFYIETPGRTFAIQPPNEQCMNIWIACLTIPPNTINVIT